MITEVYFVENECALIPSELLLAIANFEGFAEVHLKYWVRMGGQYGLCTYQEAFENLTTDLRDHNLPVKYSTFRSFKSMKTKTGRK